MVTYMVWMALSLRYHIQTHWKGVQLVLQSGIPYKWECPLFLPLPQEGLFGHVPYFSGSDIFINLFYDAVPIEHLCNINIINEMM
jgi:hypothetical protein